MKFGSAKAHRGLMVILTAVLAVLLSVAALAEEDHGIVKATGLCGDDLTWKRYEDGYLEISGSGEMYDYSLANQSIYPNISPWFGFRSSLKALILCEGITSIGDSAFNDCSTFTGGLTIPDSVTSIGIEAFRDCGGFSNVLSLGKNIVTIKSGAFLNCSGFTGDLIIPDSVTTIESDALAGCSGFTGSLILGKNLSSIGERAFYDCSGFTGPLYIPNSVSTITASAFYGCSSLSTLTIADTVSEIQNNAFQNCSSLKSVTFTGNAPALGDDVFSGCSDEFRVYCSKEYAHSFITYGGKWNGYPLVVLEDDEVTPEITLCLTGATLDVGSTIQLVAVVTGDAAEEGVVWTSSDDTVASVKDGTVTALAEGTAVITAAAKAGGTPVSFEVKVNPAPAPVIRGDIDGDGFITAKDRMILARYLAGWQGYNQYFEK